MTIQGSNESAKTPSNGIQYAVPPFEVTITSWEKAMAASHVVDLFGKFKEKALRIAYDCSAMALNVAPNLTLLPLLLTTEKRNLKEPCG